jgi:hypothetical protein
MMLLENWLETKAGVEPYPGGFLLHYLDRLGYPDVSATALTSGGVIICVLNLTFYAGQMWNRKKVCTDDVENPGFGPTTP